MTRDERRVRREAVMAAVEGGMTRQHAANVFGLSYIGVYKITRSLGVLSRQCRKQPPGAREHRMMEMYRAGLTLQQIGSRFDVTRERVRQILRKHGVAPLEGGSHVRGIAVAAKRAARSERYWIDKYGCPLAVTKEIRAANGVRPYQEQRRSSLRRGIKWGLTLKQWWDLWQQSGHWNERGRGRDRYCMARVGDQGAYEFGNVYITTNRENVQEFRKRKPVLGRTETPGIYLIHPGRSKPYMARHGKKFIGMYPTVAAATAAKLAFLAQREAA